MIRGIRNGYRALFIVTVSGALLLFTLDSFGAFALKNVTLDGETVPIESSVALGFVPGASVLHQPLDATANMMCRRVGIGAAHVSVVSRHSINIRTNEFYPVYLVHDARSKVLRGLTAELVIVPLDTERDIKPAPMFIGLKDLELFERPADFRLEAIVQGLLALQDEDEKLYSTISAIDCSEDTYLTVSFLNTDMLLLTTAFNIDESISQLQAIISGASDITQEATVVDMRFEGLMIIPGENKPQSKRTKKKRNG